MGVSIWWPPGFLSCLPSWGGARVECWGLPSPTTLTLSGRYLCCHARLSACRGGPGSACQGSWTCPCCSVQTCSSWLTASGRGSRYLHSPQRWWWTHWHQCLHLGIYKTRALGAGLSDTQPLLLWPAWRSQACRWASSESVRPGWCWKGLVTVLQLLCLLLYPSFISVLCTCWWAHWGPG